MMVAIPAGLMLQVPPVEASVSVVHAPTHILKVPPIAAGRGVTVTILLEVQPPEPNEFIIVVVPAVIPVTTPVDEFTVPTAVTVLLHEPPPEDDVSVISCPTHTLFGPLIVPGPEF